MGIQEENRPIRSFCTVFISTDPLDEHIAAHVGPALYVAPRGSASLER